MAKDDYDVLVFKILTYLYACMKRKIVFDALVFAKTTGQSKVPEGYFTDVLRLMQVEGLIEGVSVVKAWGTDYILASDLRDMSITADGIRYLKDNSKMKEVRQALVDAADVISGLIAVVNLK